MAKKHPRIPLGLLIAVGVMLVLGFAAGPIIRSLATPEQLASNVLLSAIPFILIFVAIILAFISVISLVASILSNQIAERPYRIIETILIVGIVLGIISMFQPWMFLIYKYGFLVLLISTLGFILWSHVTPRREQRKDQTKNILTSNIES